MSTPECLQAGFRPYGLLVFFISFILLSGFHTAAYGYQAEPDTTEADTISYWDMNWVAGISGSQAVYSNWSKGGTNSMSLSSMSLIQLKYEKNSFEYEFRVRTRFGKARIQDQGVRKTDDQISIRNRFLFDINPDDESDFRLFGNVNFETQFAEGFNYGAGPEGEDVLTSDFLAPAYFTQNAGLAYFPQADFSLEAGLGLRQTVVQDTTLSTRYGLDEGTSFRLEGGYTTGINFEFEIMEDIKYIGVLETFTNIHRSIRKTDIYFSNEFTGKVNDYVNVNFRLDIRYDDDFSSRLQLSQALSAGVTIDIY
jgi:hypothetical protein